MELSLAGVCTVRGRPVFTDAVGATLLSHGDEGAITETQRLDVVDQYNIMHISVYLHQLGCCVHWGLKACLSIHRACIPWPFDRSGAMLHSVAFRVYLKHTIYRLRNVLAHLIATLVSKTKRIKTYIGNILALFFCKEFNYGKLVREFSFTV